MKGIAAASALALGIATWSGIQAHEGHKHPDEKVVGTVVQVDHSDAVGHIEVKTTTGDTVVLTVDKTTKYLKGKATTTLAEVKPGLRIVAKVTKDGEVAKTSEIALGVVDPGVEQRGAEGKEHPHETPHDPMRLP